jgi:hypothetical protein
VSRCALPPRQCLWEHVRHKAKAAGLKPEETKDNRGRPGLSLLCPAHNDGKRSLSVTVADLEAKRLVWCCHAGCPDFAVRFSLIDRAHIDAACLPLARADTADVLDSVVAELRRPTKDHAQKVLTAFAVALGYKEVPRGLELERLASDVSVGMRSAYKVSGYRPDNP